jgi:hypothetical protein
VIFNVAGKTVLFRGSFSSVKFFRFSKVLSPVMRTIFFGAGVWPLDTAIIVSFILYNLDIRVSALFQFVNDFREFSR